MDKKKKSSYSTFLYNQIEQADPARAYLKESDVIFEYLSMKFNSR